MENTLNKNEKPISTYKAIYRVVLLHDLLIDAESEQEARSKFEQKSMNGELDFSDGVLDDSQIIYIQKI